MSEAGHRAFWAQGFADGWGLCKNATDGLTPWNPWRYSIRGNHIEGRAGWPSNERTRASLRSVLNFAGLFRGVFVASAPVGKTLRSKRSMTGFWHGAGLYLLIFVPGNNIPHVFKALEKRVYGGSKTSAILHVCLHICKQGITYSNIRVL